MTQFLKVLLNCKTRTKHRSKTDLQHTCSHYDRLFKHKILILKKKNKVIQDFRSNFYILLLLKITTHSEDTEQTKKHPLIKKNKQKIYIVRFIVYSKIFL